jgi:capsular exopolysaccharide synthesis family protein
MDRTEVIPPEPRLSQPVPFPRGVEPPPTLDLKRDHSGIFEYWQMVRRHQFLVILAIFLGGISGYFRTIPEVRIYQAHISLEIQGVNEDFLNMRNVNPNVTTTYSPDYDIQTQVRILQSRTLLKLAYGKLANKKWQGRIEPPDRLSLWRKALKINPPDENSLWDQALSLAAGSVRVRASGMNRIVDVSCDSTNPQVAAEFLNVLAQEYIQQNREARWKATELTGEWLTNQLHDIKIKLEKADDQLQAYARTARLTITDEKTNVDEEKLRQLQRDLSAAQSDRVGKQSRLEMANSAPPDSLPDVVDDQNLSDYQHILTDLRKQLAQLRTTFTPNHTEVQKVQAQITAVEAELEKERTAILRRIRNDYEAAARKEKLLSAAYANQAQLVTEQAAKLTHYAILKREVDTSRALYETLLQKLKEASISAALRSSNIRVVDDAEPAGGPYKPDVYRSCIMGLIVGFCFGIGYAVMRERADRTIQDPGDVSLYLNVPELGVIPARSLQPTGKKETTRELISPAAATNGHGPTVKCNVNRARISSDFRVEVEAWIRRASLLAESFRTTLTSILFSKDGDPPRVVVLTSASPKEGKTTIATNLAICAAEINRRVVLIDGDMRRPHLHTIFAQDNSKGLGDLLLGTNPLDDAAVGSALLQTGVPGLFLLPSGAFPNMAPTLVHSNRLPELIAILRRTFDTIVIDTPPMVNISDARMIARYCDALVLVIRSGVTTRDAAALANRRFIEDGIRVTGVILNGWNPKTPGYHYYRSYYSGYQHYYGEKNGNGVG